MKVLKIVLIVIAVLVLVAVMGIVILLAYINHHKESAAILIPIVSKSRHLFGGP